MNALQISTDGAVISASRQDPAAFAALLDRHWVRIHRYCVVRAGPPGEELAAETFRVAFDRRHDEDPDLLRATAGRTATAELGGLPEQTGGPIVVGRSHEGSRS